MPSESADSQIILPQRPQNPVFWTRRRIVKAAVASLLWGGGYTLRQAHTNAWDIQYRHEKIPLTLPPELARMKILFLTDPHIGGNIGAIAYDVGLKTRSLLEGDDPTETIILHGGDFVSRSPTETPLKILYRTSPLLYGPLAGCGHHIWVRGNHDLDHSRSPEVIDYFAHEHRIDFLTRPDQKRTVNIGNAEVAVFGLDTGAAILHNMDPQARNNLLDTYIENLNSGKQSCNILLMHNPDAFEFLLRRLKETKTKITVPTICFAGHTHGGMIDIPWLVDFALSRIHVQFWRYAWWYKPEWEYAGIGEIVLYVWNGMGNSPNHDYRWFADPEVVSCAV